MDFGRVNLTLAHIRSFVLWCFIWFDSDLIGIVHISPHRPITTHGPLKPSFQVFVMLSQPVQYLPSLQLCQSISVIICRYAVDMSRKPEACNELTCFRYLQGSHVLYLAHSPPPIADSSSIMHVAHWIAARLGLEPIRQQPIPNNVASTSCDAVNIDSTLWPEGHQLRREVRSTAQTGWAQSNWAWCSVGHVNYPGSIHPKPDRAESCFCLGVLRCQSSGKLVHSRTKTAEMKAQILRNCPGQGCGDGLEWITGHCASLLRKMAWSIQFGCTRTSTIVIHVHLLAGSQHIPTTHQ